MNFTGVSTSNIKGPAGIIVLGLASTAFMPPQVGLEGQVRLQQFQEAFMFIVLLCYFNISLSSCGKLQLLQTAVKHQEEFDET